MTLPDFLVEVPYGAIRLTGHRIDLLHVIEPYKEGQSAEMLALQYPTLSLAQIHKVIAFYLENRDEVDAYLARCRAELERQIALSPRIDWEELKRRWLARKLGPLPASEPSIYRQGHWPSLGDPGLVEIRQQIEATHQAEMARCHR